jgi:hypothetical protein
VRTVNPNAGDLVVCETRIAVWNYHLRIIGKEGFKPGGGEGLTSLCLREMGWDTHVPVSAYHKPSTTPAHWCDDCWDVAKIRYADKVKKEKLE